MKLYLYLFIRYHNRIIQTFYINLEANIQTKHEIRDIIIDARYCVKKEAV